MSIDFTSFIDVKIAILLWCLGWAIKHIGKIKLFKNIPNDAIPIILFGIGIVGTCIETGDVSLNGIIMGVITAGFAVGIHSSGKNIFKLAAGTTIYATPDSITNSTAKQERNKTEYINNQNYMNSDNYDFTSDVNTVDDGEVILDVPVDTGRSVG
jgi:hypothetical protein